MDAIAFYLPQYHSIPENDRVYGSGFTEWDNVRNARPLFPGHYQPRAPHKTFGYYSLVDEKFINFQHEVAYDNGVKGFCYYYYNFAGKRLLEKPVDIVNRNKFLKNKFCLCWPHAGWYDNRNSNRDIFIEQSYSVENATLIFNDLLQYLENNRYITVDGKPLFLVFAPERHPLMREYADIWHELAIKRGFPGIWLAGVEAYMAKYPYELGFDSMVEYAPNWSGETMLTSPEAAPRLMDYAATLRFMLSRDLPPYIRNRCVFPGWDNTPRRGAQGIAVLNTSPELYKTYLDMMAEYTQDYLPSNMQYVFINAWNEWGEGCYIEPDTKNGFTYLNITREIMAKYG